MGDVVTTETTTLSTVVEVVVDTDATAHVGRLHRHMVVLPCLRQETLLQTEGEVASP